MKIAYLDCASGISGDMTLAALVDAGVPLEALQRAIDSLGIPGCRLVESEVKKKGFRARQIVVQHEPEHAHRHLRHIVEMIDRGDLSPAQRDLAKSIFNKIAVAESAVHGTTIEKVHFHEVGAVDSIADIVGAAVGWDLLGADCVVASPIPTGTGFVQIAHGRCSIPAPATAEILKGIPLAASSVEAELTTPTGAAMVATLVERFGPLPPMQIDRIGYGAGQRDLDAQPNLLRLLVGEAVDSVAEESVWVVETNLDDTSGEMIGYCAARLWDLGALDVHATAIQMKKDRPGVKLTVLCHADALSQVEETLFRETTTLGIRRWQAGRHTLRRRPQQVETPHGPVEGTVAQLPDGSVTFAPQYESCRRLAEQRKVSLREIYQAASTAFTVAKAT